MPLAQQNRSTNLSVAHDVRKLIRQAQAGQGFDIVLEGHACDVTQDVGTALQARLSGAHALETEISERLERFARKNASAGVYLRLVITDRLPDLPDYDPSQVSVFDGIQDGGTDFSQVIQRSTVYGTLMTSVTMTDLRAYFESGRKRSLLMYLGTDKMGDLESLETIIAFLPAFLATQGFDGATIKRIVADAKAGKLPPAALKVLHDAGTLAKLQLQNAKQALPPAAARKMQALQKSLQSLENNPAIMRLLPPVIGKLLQAVVLRAASPAPFVAARAFKGVATPANNNAPQKPQAQMLRGQALKTVLARILKAAPKAGVTARATKAALATRTPLRTTLKSAFAKFMPAARILGAMPAITRAFTWAPKAAATMFAPVQRLMGQTFAAPTAQATTNRASARVASPVPSKSGPATQAIKNMAPASATNPVPAHSKTPTAPQQPVSQAPSKPAQSQPAAPANPAPAKPEAQKPEKPQSICGPFCQCAAHKVASAQITTKADVLKALGADVAARLNVAEARAYVASAEKAEKILQTAKVQVHATSNARAETELLADIKAMESGTDASGKSGHIHGPFCGCAAHGGNQSANKMATEKTSAIKMADNLSKKTITAMTFEP